ncbi:GDSL-type esterase/lipase family protein [Streptomyces sp. NPDC079167]|uniref:GDSL-type esterase/lipase family protein n=1 Tax=Streptomyces sp. NPDC079167 TaxID=3154513 RepID=UPI003449606E
MIQSFLARARRLRAPQGRRTSIALAATAMAAALTVSAPTTNAVGDTASGQQAGTRGWFTSWANSQHDLAPTPLHDQTVRMISHLSQGGDALRIRIQNTFGTTPLTVDAATVGLTDGRSAATRGRPRPVTFDGRPEAVIPAGGELWSDATALRTRARTDIAVSLSVSGTVVPGRHGTAFRTNYLTAPGTGDHTRDTGPAAYTETTESTYLVTAVDVHNPRLKGSLVAYGSSVVDGVGSTDCGPGCTRLGANRRWTDDLARRINTELPPTGRLAVANAGVNGTTSAPDCPKLAGPLRGLDAGARLERDVLALHGVTGVLYYYGTNDLPAGCDAQQVLASYRDTFRRLHEAGIKVYVTPVTPRPGYTDEHNRVRHTVNSFVLNRNDCSGTCDGIMGFDQVLKDPVEPNAINPSYDTGDGVHVNISGQEALAGTLSLPMLASSAHR